MSNTETTSLTCSDELADLLERLRTAQRGYFSCKHGTLKKVEWLQTSKALEKELDTFLVQRRKALSEPTLF